MSEQLQLNFDGPDLEKEDHVRLAGQILAIFSVMQDRTWRTLAEIARVTGAPEASASAQLRHLRKARFGGHTVERRRRGAGLYEYRLHVVALIRPFAEDHKILGHSVTAEC